jgi:16S rRNA (guanine1207-N2)-methyltransferase
MNTYEALKWFFEKEGDPFAGRQGAAIVHAKTHPFLHTLKQPVCVQGFYPDYERLKTAGFEVRPELTGGPFTGALLLADKHKEATFATLAALADRLEEGAPLVVVAPNNLGGKTLAKAVRELFGSAQNTSKHHCTVALAHKNSAVLDGDRLKEWHTLGEPKRIAAGYQTVPGIFSHAAIDTGSQLLIDALKDERLAGRVADLGGGWGFLSGELLKTHTAIAQIDLYEASYAATQMARLNLPADRTVIHWCDATAPLSGGDYDAIVTNPPFHTGAQADTALGQAFIHAAHRALKPGGTLYLVANRHLPYESILSALFKTHRVLSDTQGFKVLSARKR